MATRSALLSLPIQSPSRRSGRPHRGLDRRAIARAELVKAQYDQHARPLPRQCVGQTVRVQDQTSHRWDKVGVMGCGTTRVFPVGKSGCETAVSSRPVPTPSYYTLPHIPVFPCSDEKIKYFHSLPCDPAPF
ncbi:hypothetical protein GWK47_054818 [Chionoecetes opilio]|uniref:Uncharacterized protein n=1 Tax=Chionoecetes opilio TaxID=41210 RepID=A0A8J4Y4Q0_CHIOP|nr:hypothetical protein GWK47_054818 [Chionoecetes opilio]